jgi:hypothetical protein
MKAIIELYAPTIAKLLSVCGIEATVKSVRGELGLTVTVENITAEIKAELLNVFFEFNMVSTLN